MNYGMKLRKMKKIQEMRNKTIFMIAGVVASFLATTGCRQTQSNQDGLDADTILEEPVLVDTTVYGVCGEGTTMHTLQLVTDQGDTLSFHMNDDETEAGSVVGGLLVGDRLAVVGTDSREGLKIVSGINLTTLIGKWTSLDKNFEIQEGGTVSSHVQAEINPWTAWKILNGRLLLNTDTFFVVQLDADSLFLENTNGIFVYKRQ